ncbi:sensor histidine kinase [Phenylobacterium sp.]|uniref:sensor histidine kinase n=1 Tax=Phenylobacterium sp. TaxID=1871053 RepID=UPI002ED82BE0
MAGAQRSSQGDPAPIRRSGAGIAATVALFTLLIAAGVAFLNSFSANAIPTMLMAAVLMVAVVLGLAYGLLAALVALIAYQLLVGAPLVDRELAASDFPLMVLFGLGALVAGRYTDIVRKRDAQARMLLQAGQPLSSQASEPALGRFLQRVKLEGRSSERASAPEEVQRALVSFCIVGAGLVASLLARDALGPSAGVLCALAGVLVVGGVLGGRFGFAAGMLAAVVLNQIDPVQSALGIREGEVGRAFIVVVFAAAGWGVGRVADQAQHERRTLRTIMDAGRDFSASRDEAAMRRALLDILAKLSPRARVEITGDAGAERLGISPSADRQWAESDPRWRVHPLASDGREVGLVRWRFPGGDGATTGLDDTTRALVDLAASAIVRARLNAEKADMEFVAQTENLRLILLDAVSHHFRSPLAGILGSVTSILNLPDQHDGAMRRELLLIIKEQTNRLSRYVDNFLSVARLETGAIVPNPTEVALEPLIYDVWETFGEAGGARRFLQAKIDHETLLTDAGLLGQVLGNVLENAIKYSPEGSVVDVRTETESDRLIIRVADCGPGIAPESQGRIFERFYRMRGVAAPGLGLGLYITRSLVEILGGSVDARNRTDGQTGLVVSVSLPLRTPANDE